MSEEISLNSKEHSRRAVHRSRKALLLEKTKNKVLQKKMHHDALALARKSAHNSSKSANVHSRYASADVFPEGSCVRSYITDKLGEYHNPIINGLENLVVLCISLSSMDNLKGMICSIFLFVKTFTCKSVVKDLTNMVKSLYTGKEFSDSDDCDFDLDAIPVLPEGGNSLLEVIKGVWTNFKLVSANPVFQKVSYLLSACVCAGLCEASSVTWSMCGVKLFTPNVYQRHIQAPDLIDAIFSTVIYFVEGGCQFFRTGSLAGFLYSDTRIESLQNSYYELESQSAYFRTGTLFANTGLDESEYSNKISETTDGLKRLFKISEGAEKIIISRMLSNIHNLKAEFDLTRVRGGIREKPYTIAIVGSSGVGKSTLTCALPPILGLMNSYDGSPKRVTTIRADDKFQPNLRGDTNVIILDDVGNTHVNFLQVSPTDSTIAICNNAIAYANMPDVDSKGKVPINPKAVIITSNLLDHGANIGSHEPASVERRAEVHIHMSVKPDFRIDKGKSLDFRKVSAFYDGNVPELPDAWLFDVTDPVVIPNSAVGGIDIIDRRPHLGEDGKPLMGCDIKQLLRFLRDHSRDFHQTQKELVSKVNTAHDRLAMCKVCDHITLSCTCQPAQAQPEGGLLWSKESEIEFPEENIVPIMQRIAEFIMVNVLGYIPLVSTYMTAKEALEIMNLSSVFRSKLTSVGVGVISDIWEFWSPATYYSIWTDRDMYHLARLCGASSVAVTFTYCIGCCNLLLTIAMLLVLAWHARCVTLRVLDRRETCYQLALRNKPVHLVANFIRDYNIKRLLSQAVMLAAAYQLIKQASNLWKLRTVIPQGELEPETEEDILERNDEINIWLKHTPENIVHDRRLTTSTVEQAVGRVANQLFSLKITTEWGIHHCNALFMRTGVFLMPYHMCFHDHNEGKPMFSIAKLSFQRRTAFEASSTFACKIVPRNVVRVPGTDIAVVRVNCGGDFACIDYMLEDQPYAGLARFVYKNQGGTFRQEATTMSRFKSVGHLYCNFMGNDYHLTGGTGPGLCMGVLISTDKARRIVGFHLGGRQPTYGVSGFLSATDYHNSIKILESNTGVLQHKSGFFSNDTHGQAIVTDLSVHSRSPVNFLTTDGIFGCYGSCPGGVTATSRVVKSKFSDEIEHLTGVPNKWGAPRMFPKWIVWNTGLTSMVAPSNGFNPDVLEWAKRDYFDPLIKRIKSNSFIRDRFRPLTIMEAVNGIPGRRFVDRMTLQTSSGFGLSGPKTNYLVPVDPPPEGYVDAVMFTDEILNEVSIMEHTLAAGERCYAIYKACVKDEPTLVTKEKPARIINAAPLVFQIVCRKYFLCLAEFMNIFPFLCESMVGINCMSPEWEQRRQKLTESETLMDRTFAIDYKSFDQKIPAQVTWAVQEGFIEMCASTGNYSDRDLAIMRGIATEVTYPFVAFNGTLLSLPGGTISGTTLTVYQNNGCTSLYKRCCFKEVELIPRGIDVSFRSGVNDANYGDDGCGTVRRWVERYNMRSFAQYMSDHGIVVTMPDKSLEMVEFMNWQDADFLKRTDNFIPELGYHLGKLSKESIYKSLHSHLRNANMSEEDHFVAVVTGTMFEMIAHGRSEFESMRGHLLTVCENNLLHVPALERTFDDSIASLIERHDKTPPVLITDSAAE